MANNDMGEETDSEIFQLQFQQGFSAGKASVSPHTTGTGGANREGALGGVKVKGYIREIEKECRLPQKQNHPICRIFLTEALKRAEG